MMRTFSRIVFDVSLFMHFRREWESRISARDFGRFALSIVAGKHRDSIDRKVTRSDFSPFAGDLSRIAFIEKYPIVRRVLGLFGIGLLIHAKRNERYRRTAGGRREHSYRIY